VKLTLEEVAQVAVDIVEGVEPDVITLNLLAGRMANERRRWERMNGKAELEGIYASDFGFAKVAIAFYRDINQSWPTPSA